MSAARFDQEIKEYLAVLILVVSSPMGRFYIYSMRKVGYG
jgi:hypothetical protein